MAERRRPGPPAPAPCGALAWCCAAWWSRAGAMPRVAFEVAWAEDAPRPRQAAAWWPAARATAEEVAPLVRKMGESAEWLEASENTDPAKALSWCCDDFRPRNLRSFHLLGWLVLQVAGLLFQLSLSREIGLGCVWGAHVRGDQARQDRR